LLIRLTFSALYGAFPSLYRDSLYFVSFSASSLIRYDLAEVIGREMEGKQSKGKALFMLQQIGPLIYESRNWNPPVFLVLLVGIALDSR